MGWSGNTPCPAGAFYVISGHQFAAHVLPATSSPGPASHTCNPNRDKKNSEGQSVCMTGITPVPETKMNAAAGAKSLLL